jgi:protein-S-isoprenylcysteine O-methyltransferase Ste14
LTIFNEIRIVLLFATTVGIVIISRRTLLNFRSHGFYRFIAWEVIAALVIWNLPYWISEPTSSRQMLSWILLFASLFVLWEGVSRLRSARRSSSRKDSELYAFERTSELITSGIYHYIRHPLYASLLYLAWGAYLKDISWISTVLIVLASLNLLATAKADERECIHYFGDQYKEYMKRSKMFIPFVL